jgi:hypothetical protein
MMPWITTQAGELVYWDGLADLETLGALFAATGQEHEPGRGGGTRPTLDLGLVRDPPVERLASRQGSWSSGTGCARS